MEASSARSVGSLGAGTVWASLSNSSWRFCSAGSARPSKRVACLMARETYSAVASSAAAESASLSSVMKF
jgi:hypothetical protein